MHFRQFDANSRKLAQERRGRTTVRSRRLRGDADAEVAQNGENAKARIGEANRATQTKKKYSNKCGQCANKTLDVVRCDLHVSGGLEHVGEDVGHRWGSDGWGLGGWLGRGVGGRERFGDERQADAVLLGVDLHDGDGDFVAEFDDRFDALDAVFGEF